FQIVSVFPNVDSQYRLPAAHPGTVLVRRRFNGNLTLFVRTQPRPTAAKYAKRGLCELILKSCERPELRVDRSGELSFWLPWGIPLHDLPEEGMIGVTSAVVS